MVASATTHFDCTAWGDQITITHLASVIFFMITRQNSSVGRRLVSYQ